MGPSINHNIHKVLERFFEVAKGHSKAEGGFTTDHEFYGNLELEHHHHLRNEKVLYGVAADLMDYSGLDRKTILEFLRSQLDK